MQHFLDRVGRTVTVTRTVVAQQHFTQACFSRVDKFSSLAFGVLMFVEPCNRLAGTASGLLALPSTAHHEPYPNLQSPGCVDLLSWLAVSSGILAGMAGDPPLSHVEVQGC